VLVVKENTIIIVANILLIIVAPLILLLSKISARTLQPSGRQAGGLSSAVEC
jgi:hypothetical protein